LLLRLLTFHGDRPTKPLEIAPPAPRADAGLPVRLLTAGVCLPFLFSGVSKLADPAAAAAEMAHFGLPAPALTAWAVVALQLGASALLVLGPRHLAWPGAFALAGFTVAATVLGHAFWTMDGPERGMHTNVFVEHLALAVALLLCGWVRSRPGPG
jgi:uncharacterized membrane protein YphA (DoxX/SURF4 family)